MMIATEKIARTTMNRVIPLERIPIEFHISTTLKPCMSSSFLSRLFDHPSKQLDRADRHGLAVHRVGLEAPLQDLALQELIDVGETRRLLDVDVAHRAAGVDADLDRRDDLLGPLLRDELPHGWREMGLLLTGDHRVLDCLHWHGLRRRRRRGRRGRRGDAAHDAALDAALDTAFLAGVRLLLFLLDGLVL